MSNIDKFKDFVRNNPSLIDYVKRGERTWQDFYELYNLYESDEQVWKKYLNSEVESKKIDIKNILDHAQNIDVNKLQEGITSVQKAIDLFGGILSKNNSSNESETYTPRPVYRRFED